MKIYVSLINQTGRSAADGTHHSGLEKQVVLS